MNASQTEGATERAQLREPSAVHPAIAAAHTQVSVLTVAYNEEMNVARLYEELKDLAARSPTVEFEFVLVDDGSNDSTASIIQELATNDSRVKPILLQRNFGQTAALAAGIEAASFPIIVTMDADLQNDPADVPMMLEKLQEGYDVVSGWRKQRQDRLFSRRVPSMLANSLIGRVTGIRLHDYGCSLKAYRASVLKNIQLYGELHRFIPALCASVGARIVEVPVNHRPRVAGRSKYNVGRTFRVILDLLTVKFLLSYSTRPMHFFGVGALLFFTIGMATGIASLLMKYGQHGMSLNRNPLFYLTIFMGFAGLQFLAVGLLSELIMRTYFESQSKRIYTVKKTKGSYESETLGSLDERID